MVVVILRQMMQHGELVQWRGLFDFPAFLFAFRLVDFLPLPQASITPASFVWESKKARNGPGRGRQGQAGVGRGRREQVGLSGGKEGPVG